MDLENAIIFFVQHLASNDKLIREKTLRKVKKYIRNHSVKGLTEDIYLKLWKGLFYCMYNADKLLVQEDLAEEISLLLHDCATSSQKELFFQCAVQTFAREWDGMDDFRTNKYMMLFTRVIRQMLFHLKKLNWNVDKVNEVVNIMEKYAQNPLGIRLFLTSIILDELAKVGKEQLTHDTIVAFLYPYFQALALSNEVSYIRKIKEFIIDWLIHQSDAAVGVVQNISEDECENVEELSDCNLDNDSEMMEDESMTVMDPRAGLDIVLPQLNVDFNKLAVLFLKLGGLKHCKNRKLIYRIVKNFQFVAQGINPFPDPVLSLSQRQIKIKNRKFVQNAVKHLKEFEDALVADNDLGVPNSKKRKFQNDILSKKSLIDTPRRVSDFTKKRKKEIIKKRRKVKFLKRKNSRAKELKEELASITDQVGILNKMLIETKKEAEAHEKVSNEKSKKSIMKKTYEGNVNLGKNVKRKRQQNTTLIKKKRTENVKTINESAKESVLQHVADPWSKPLKDGEYEFVVQKKSIKKGKGVKAPPKKLSPKRTPNSSGRTLKINLKKNSEHEFKDYRKILDIRPEIPYSSLKKPKESVLKRSSIQKSVSAPVLSLSTPKLNKKKKGKRLR